MYLFSSMRRTGLFDADDVLRDTVIIGAFEVQDTICNLIHREIKEWLLSPYDQSKRLTIIHGPDGSAIACTSECEKPRIGITKFISQRKFTVAGSVTIGESKILISCGSSGATVGFG